LNTVTVNGKTVLLQFCECDYSVQFALPIDQWEVYNFIAFEFHFLCLILYFVLCEGAVIVLLILSQYYAGYHYTVYYNAYHSA